MRLRNEKVLSLLLCLVIIGFSVWGHFNLPDGPVAVHFGLDGEANGFQPRDTALLIMPGASLALAVLLLWILPAIMPKSASIDRSAGAYGAIATAAIAVLAVTHGALILKAQGAHVDMGKLAFVSTGLLFIIIGNFLPKMRKNWIAGIRTPWTLSDERVWDRTHRMAGLWMLLGGAAMIAGAFWAPDSWRGPIFIATIVVPPLGAVVYSYFVARKLDLV